MGEGNEGQLSAVDARCDEEAPQPMRPTNPVYQLLEGLVRNPPQQLHYRNQFYAFDGVDTPWQCSMTFLQGQIRTLRTMLKELEENTPGS